MRRDQYRILRHRCPPKGALLTYGSCWPGYPGIFDPRANATSWWLPKVREPGRGSETMRKGTHLPGALIFLRGCHRFLDGAHLLLAAVSRPAFRLQSRTPQTPQTEASADGAHYIWMISRLHASIRPGLPCERPRCMPREVWAKWFEDHEKAWLTRPPTRPHPSSVAIPAPPPPQCLHRCLQPRPLRLDRSASWLRRKQAPIAILRSVARSHPRCRQSDL
ncbi:hypothetical protein CC79DRAFT_452706 [Sarocladium strictum]